MTATDDLSEARIFVGSDRSQLLAVKVLEHSIRRRTDMRVTLRSMHDLELPDPADIRQGKRTGFSFTRFAIPELAGHTGRALYLDADMLVLRDLRELYALPFDGAKVLIQESGGAKRVKQCSVMLLNCEALQWDARQIIAGLDGAYTYEQLMRELCILAPAEIGYSIPFQWNSLEVYEPGRTGLIHYTDMNTQPWVFAGNKNGWLWLNEVRDMIASGALTMAEIDEEIRLGYFRPSLALELAQERQNGPLPNDEASRLNAFDAARGYKPHAEVYAQAERRRAAIAALSPTSSFSGALASLKRHISARLG